jgi:hypothetical protein
MSFPYTPNLEDEKLQSLQTQYEYLKLLRLRHLQWRHTSDDPNADRAHQRVADLIEGILDQYSRLLKAR